MENRKTLNVYGLMGYLGVGRNRAYELMKSRDFPSIRISPRRIVVPVDALEVWLKEQSMKRHIEGGG